MMTSHNDQNNNPPILKSNFTLNEIETTFSKSNEQSALLDSLKPLRKTHGWDAKIENLASKKLNDEVKSGNTSEFENYVENITDFGLKTLPKTISSKIQEEVSRYVKDFTRPLTEIYKEAMFKAAEKGIDRLLQIKQEKIIKAPLLPCVKYIQYPKPNNHKNTQVQNSTNEIGIQTFPGLGNYDDEDFDAIVNNDNVQLLYPNEEHYNSDEECGKMTEKEDKMLMEKLQKLEERQQRMEKDYQKAANPDDYLELNERNSDHRQTIEKIKRLTEFGVKIYDNSISKIKSSQPPAILTYKWNGKFYKHVVLQNTEDVYLYLPPPELPLKTKRKNNSDEESIPPKIVKSNSFNNGKA